MPCLSMESPYLYKVYAIILSRLPCMDITHAHQYLDDTQQLAQHRQSSSVHGLYAPLIHVHVREYRYIRMNGWRGWEYSLLFCFVCVWCLFPLSFLFGCVVSLYRSIVSLYRVSIQLLKAGSNYATADNPLKVNATLGKKTFTKSTKPLILLVESGVNNIWQYACVMRHYNHRREP